MVTSKLIQHLPEGTVRGDAGGCRAGYSGGKGSSKNHIEVGFGACLPFPYNDEQIISRLCRGSWDSATSQILVPQPQSPPAPPRGAGGRPEALVRQPGRQRRHGSPGVLLESISPLHLSVGGGSKTLMPPETFLVILQPPSHVGCLAFASQAQSQAGEVSPCDCTPLPVAPRRQVSCKLT